MSNRHKVYVHRVEFQEPEIVGYGDWITSTPKAQLVIEVDTDSIRGVDFQDLFLVDGRTLMTLNNNDNHNNEPPIYND